TTAIASRIRKGRFVPAKAKELDAPLRSSFAIPPVYPTALKRKGVDGTARIEVIVDKKGRAVLPRILEASEPEFGWAAATAVQRWRFDPPTVGGKPVEVKVVIPIRFTPPPLPTEPAQ
ncbi:MAG TPA: energy transducer TonB, partial [Opitutaceae bacterium]|nr:energy transducer TonB [Opitutaceae bacterium]